MIRKIELRLMGLAMVLILSACQAMPWGMDALPWLSTDQILLRDDFSNQQSGWQESASQSELKGYTAEGYLISAKSANARSWAQLGLWLGDVQISTSARILEGANSSKFGLICRFTDKDNYYAFLVGADNSASILRVLEGRESLLAETNLAASPRLSLDGGDGMLSASCDGENLSFSINGMELLGVEDQSLQTGDVGLILQSSGDGGASVLFNSFEIRKK